VDVVAHIGNIPVEEWLPFVVPFLALFIYGRRRERRRRSAVAKLPAPGELLDERVLGRVLERLREGGHGDVAARHVALLYPPGPDGMTVEQLASHGHTDPDTVRLLLEELEELGYVELEDRDRPEPRAALTIEGYDLVNATEAALIDAARDRAAAAG
jgi:DNA-binding transcriptional ArsR family regulator